MKTACGQRRSASAQLIAEWMPNVRAARVAAHDQRVRAQLRILQLLDGRVKGVEVEMGDDHAAQPKARSGEHPLLVAENWDSVAAVLDAVELDLGPADHEVRVDARDVPRPLRQVDAVVPREGEPAAVGDVTGRVL